MQQRVDEKITPLLVLRQILAFFCLSIHFCDENYKLSMFVMTACRLNILLIVLANDASFPTVFF